MLNYILRRLLQALVTLLPVTAIFYVVIRNMPTNSALQMPLIFGLSHRLPLNLQFKMADHVWNLNIPWAKQYFLWVGQTLSGTFGKSFYIHEPAIAVLNHALGPSLALMGMGLCLTILVGVPLGVAQAMHRNTVFDHTCTGLSYILMAVPPYLLGLAMMLVFAVRLQWLPPGGLAEPLQPVTFASYVQHLILPATTLALVNVATYARYMRSSVLDQLPQLYIRTAHAKGLAPRRISWRHIVPNAFMPVFMTLASNLGQIFSQAFIIEILYSWPGLGELFVQSMYAEDYNVLMALIVVAGAMILLVNVAADVAYATIDHRIVYD